MQHEAVDEHAQALFDGIEAAVPGWVERCVERRLLDYRGVADGEVMSTASDAGRRSVYRPVPVPASQPGASPTSVQDSRTDAHKPKAILLQLVPHSHG